jgi:hypothetical protein
MLLTSEEHSDSSSIEASSSFTSLAAVRSSTASEKEDGWIVSDGNGNGNGDAGAAAAQNAGAIGSGMVAGTVVGVAVVLGLIAGLIFLFLLRFRRKQDVPINVEAEDQELTASFGEWSDYLSAANGSFADSAEESLTIYKPR